MMVSAAALPAHCRCAEYEENGLHMLDGYLQFLCFSKKTKPITCLKWALSVI
jgi:hypothetical protein